jgi:molybdopterin synthase catalytic subunit
VRVRLFAALRELAGTAEVEVPDPSAPDVDAVVRLLAGRWGERFAAIVAAGSVVVNGEPAGRDRRLSPGDQVALLPPVSGGRGAAGSG